MATMAEAGREAGFASEESFTQETFRRWLEQRSPADPRHYELIGGRIVMSPPAGDRTEKLEIYARSGVEEYWIVDPDRCEVSVHSRLGEGFDAAEIHAGGAVVSRVLPELDARIEDIFAGIG